MSNFIYLKAIRLLFEPYNGHQSEGFSIKSNNFQYQNLKQILLITFEIYSKFTTTHNIRNFKLTAYKN